MNEFQERWADVKPYCSKCGGIYNCMCPSKADRMRDLLEAFRERMNDGRRNVNAADMAEWCDEIDEVIGKASSPEQVGS